MERNIEVLVVEDSENDYLLLLRELKKSGYTIMGNRVETADGLKQALLKNKWDVIISDNSLPSLNAPKALEISRKKTKAPFIIVSGTINEEDAVNAMKLGANDYIFKGNLSRLLPAFKRELREAENRRKKEVAEHALHESEEKFRILAESIGDTFFALNNQLQCIYWNAQAAKLTCISHENALGMPLQQLLPSLPKSAIDTVMNAIAKGSVQTVTIHENKASYLEMTCYPFNEGVSIILKDISELKRTAFKLEKVNIELATFMYRLSHDLKGPVASIMGLVELAKKDLEGPVAANYCDMLEASTKNLKEVLESLLDVTKIKTGDINPTAVSLTEISNKVISSLLYRIQSTEANVTLPDEDLIIYTDKAFMGSILQNLIENAIKYGGNRQERPLVKIWWEQSEKETKIYISDNGPGIPKDLQDGIFNMFFRANETNSGSGLGLYIVKSAVEAIGGTVTLQNGKEKGKGCTFCVKLNKLSNG